MSKKKKIVLTIAVLVVLAILVCWLWSSRPEAPAQDEAMAAGIRVSFFAQAPDEADYFKDMDGGGQYGQYTPAQVQGRNTWMIWSGGNQAFWDYLTTKSFGTFDLLKTISSYPCSPEQEKNAQAYEKGGLKGLATEPGEGLVAPPGYYDNATKDGPLWGVCKDTMYPPPGRAPYRDYTRDTRFCFMGLINEPGFVKPTEPDQYGLCLDKRVAAEPEPFDEKVYGKPTGILGLRLYPNPNFDAEAEKRWKKHMKKDDFYLNPSYSVSHDLVRPYRIGMACSFCHVSPYPLHPPADPENPQFADLSGTIGAQYLWFGRVFGANVTPDNFVWHLLDAMRPGAVDTSFIPSDNLINPRAMNPIFNLQARLNNGKKYGTETSAGGALNLPYVATQKPSYTFGVPHVLWDGADSVGIDAALTRVYINIGEYHQEWVKHISPLIGAKKQTPITVLDAQQNSVYWNATQARSAALAQYLIQASHPARLKDVPEGQAVLAAQDPAKLDRGKVVFAETCARCHSSKLPEQPPSKTGVPLLNEPGCIGKDYRKCWNQYWEWTQTPDFKRKMTEIVQRPDFLDGNYMSNDARIPVDVLETEICSSMASNSVEGHVWDNFSSKSYKDLPSVGDLALYEPVEKKWFNWTAPGGGRGYQRVPTLMSAWATAPYLHNNEVGWYTGDPSVAGRLYAFDDGIRRMLHLEPHLKPLAPRGTYVHTTSFESYIRIDTSVLPTFLKGVVHLLGLVNDNHQVSIGPVPKNTPVNILGNANFGHNDPKVSTLRLAFTTKSIIDDLVKIRDKREKILADKTLTPQQRAAQLAQLSQEASEMLGKHAGALVKVSACPDFIVDRGHNFDKGLSVPDKEALIEFIKTL